MTQLEVGIRRVVRDGEGRVFVLSGLLAFSVLAVSVLTLGCITALFLGARPKSDLPWAYGATSLFGVLASGVVTWASERFARIREAVAIILLFALALVATYALTPSLPSAALFVAYPVCTGMASLTLVQAFAIISDCLDAEQAKRLLPLIGASGTIGALGAGLAMALLAPRLGVATLLLVGALVLCAVAFLTVRLVRGHVSETALSLRPPAKSARPRPPVARVVRNAFALLWDDQLIRLFALLQLVLMVGSTLLKYEFESGLAERLTIERITVFLGLFNLVANGAVLLVQTLVEGKLIRRYGFTAGLMSVPVVFALLAPFVLFAPGLGTVSAVRLGEHVTRFSLTRTAEDLVLLPVSSVKRRRARTLITGALMPLAVLLASLFIVQLGPDAGRTRVVSLFLSGALGLVLVMAMRRPYLERLRGSLANARVALISTGFSLAAVTNRAGMREAVELALGSSDPRRLLFGLSMAAEHHIPVARERLTPLYRHPDGRVREAAFLTSERVGSADLTSTLLAAFHDERDAHARLACARALCRHMPEGRLDELAPLLADESPAVRAEALARRYAARREDTDIFARLSQGDDLERAGVAHALGQVVMPNSTLLTGLLRDASLEVRRAALSAAARSYEPLHLPLVLAALDEPSLSRKAADVLQAWPASVAVPALENAARDATAKNRRRLALAALGRIPHPDAVRALLSFLDNASDDIRYSALLALSRQRARGADLTQGRARFLAALEKELRRAQWAELARDRLANAGLTPTQQRSLTNELTFFGQRAEERMFGWLALIYPREDILRAQRTLLGKDAKARAFAFELLEQRLDVALRKELVPYLRAPPQERVARAARALGLTPESSLREIMATSDELVARWLSMHLGFVPEAHAKGDPTMSVLETMFVLRTVEIFSELSSEELRAVAELAETVRFPAQSVVFREGEPGDALFIVLRGAVCVSREGVHLATLSEGECFGELALLDRGTRSATITAESDCELARIAAEDFHDLLDEAPSIARNMLAVLARRTQDLLDRGLSVN